MRKGDFEKIISLAFFSMCLFLSNACSTEKPQVENSNSNKISVATITPQSLTNVFDDYLKFDISPADGFEFPFGRENGKRNYQEVFATANGRVVFSENCGDSMRNVVKIEHVFYENNRKRKVRSIYTHLEETKVKNGDNVHRHQPIAGIGNSAQIYFELNWNENAAPVCPASEDFKDQKNYSVPTEFINAHSKLFVPQQETTLVLVDQKSYKMRLYKNGNLQGEYEVSFGQSKGVKQVQGDNKTPAGMYFIVQKHRGKFDGEYGGYYGGHWIKINYPNQFDAERAIANGILNNSQAVEIKTRWNNRKATLENTKLGGGIGFHGWIREWDKAGPRHLSWGGVVMHIYDISKIFDEMPIGTMVIIFQ